MEPVVVPAWWRMENVTKVDRAGFVVASVGVPWLLTKAFFPISINVAWPIQLAIIAAFGVCVFTVWRAVYLAGRLAHVEQNFGDLIKISNDMVNEIERLRATHEHSSPRKYFIIPSREFTAHVGDRFEQWEKEHKTGLLP